VTLTQHAHIYRFPTSNFNFGHFVLIFFINAAPNHGMSLEDAQTKCIDVIPTPWTMTHALGLVSFPPQHQQLAP
jgi:hypothetical protein